MIDGHVHIERGDYSIQWINEFVKYALDRGISEIYLLEHSHRFLEFKEIYQNIASYNKYQGSWLSQKMTLSIDTYKEFINEVRKHQFPLTIKFGLEVCFVEGAEGIIKDALKDFGWDFITGSVHWIDNWGFDHKKEFWEGKDIDKLYFRYYEIMKSLIKSGLFNIVAHPDSIKCFGYFPSFDLKRMFFASTFWTKLQNIFGHCCMSKLDKIAMPRLATNIPATSHCRHYLIVKA